MKIKFVNPILLSALITGGLCVGLAKSNYQDTMTPVTVGQMAPDFALEDEKGNGVRLSNELKKTPVVLVFYRGYW